MSSASRRPDQAIPDNPSLNDLAVAIRMEREAREAAMADQQKHLNWRFIHFAEEFNQRIDQIEQRTPFEEPSLHGAAPLDSEAFESQRRHLHEGKLVILETRLAEVQRWGDAFEAQLEQQREELRKIAVADVRHRLQEVQVWLSRADLRLAGLEAKVGRHPGAIATSERTSPSNSSAGTPSGLKGSRLAPVERVSLDARPMEVSGMDHPDSYRNASMSDRYRGGYSGDSASTCSTAERSARGERNFAANHGRAEERLSGKMWSMTSYFG
eukprot:TRINITY_DN111215_c0_g1_i1.p1 TRINITY_DN111215_c0_g1~~TRINITY_DN111215_c0_g1_i1.p1  ORF type:complete len:269 (+),score=66.38 TRINITY_DN111215_c0_g1_i1:48-854(+)